MKQILFIVCIVYSNLFSNNIDSAFLLELMNGRWKADKFINENDTTNKHLLELNNINESVDPLLKPFKTIEEVYLHPSKSTTVLLPEGSKIESAYTLGYSEVNFQQSLNILDFITKENFISDTATVVFSLDEKIYLLKIKLEKYKQSTKPKNTFYSIISLYMPKKVSDVNVLLAYEKEYGEFPQNKYSFIKLDGITYKIILDDKYGKIKINNMKYRIETRKINE